jgi:hypothetical protein
MPADHPGTMDDGEEAMPLRDHFRSPVNDKHSWDALHGMWPAMIVRQLYDLLPSGYVSAPIVHLGRTFEIDISAFEEDEPSRKGHGTGSTAGGVATSAPPRPTLTLEADLDDQDEYEVRIYDAERERRLVAAIEIVSPSNKDRPESRRVFVAKLAALLKRGVCVSIVDLVSIRQANLYAELLELVGGADPAFGPEPPHLYSATIRGRERPRGRPLLDAWFYPMSPGRPLPTLPLWLDVNLSVMLPLEPGYEETCRLLHIA